MKRTHSSFSFRDILTQHFSFYQVYSLTPSTSHKLATAVNQGSHSWAEAHGSKQNNHLLALQISIIHRQFRFDSCRAPALMFGQEDPGGSVEDRSHYFLQMGQLLWPCGRREAVFTSAGSQLPHLVKVSPSNHFTEHESNTCSCNKTCHLLFQHKLNELS